MLNIVYLPESRVMMDKQPELFKNAVFAAFRKCIFSIEAASKGTFGKAGKLKVRTGHLRRSIKSKVTMKQSSITGTVGSNVIYAAIHEYGGTIKPVRAQYLHFRTQSGAWVRTKQVTIPARPYIGPAFKDGLKNLGSFVDDEVKKAGMI